MTYKYYLWGETIPVRVTFNNGARIMGAEVPNKEIAKLVQDAPYLSRLEQSFDVDEIMEDQFRRHCEAVLGRSLR